MFSQFKVEQNCQRCRYIRRNETCYCRRPLKTSRAPIKSRRERYALQLRLPPQIPNSTLLEHVATSCFFHHYALPASTFYRVGIEWASEIVDSAHSRRKLAEIIVALGILTLPERSPASISASQIRYTKALRLTNRALQDPDTARTDETLLAVVLLGLYETTPDKSHSITSWNAHLDGARMLLHMQGVDRLSSGPTHNLFVLLTVQIVLHCFMSLQAIPPDLIQLSAQIAETQSAKDKAAAALVALFERLCALLVAEREIDCDRYHILVQAEILDDKLVDWTERLPSEYAYWEEATSPDIRAFGKTYGVYATIFGAEVWNLYRSARMSLNGLIIKQCTILDPQNGRERPDNEPEHFNGEETTFSKRERRFAILDCLRKDICASLPFLLDQHRLHDRRLSDIPLHSRTLVVHMLHFIRNSSDANDGMSTWATKLLNEMQQHAHLDSGAIWMNTPQEGIQSVAVQML